MSESDNVVLSLARGDGLEIRIYSSEYNGRQSARLHEWYRGDDGTMRPGKRIITLRPDELRSVIGALTRLAKQLQPETASAQRPAAHSAPSAPAAVDSELF